MHAVGEGRKDETAKERKDWAIEIGGETLVQGSVPKTSPPTDKRRPGKDPEKENQFYGAVTRRNGRRGNKKGRTSSLR